MPGATSPSGGVDDHAAVGHGTAGTLAERVTAVLRPQSREGQHVRVLLGVAELVRPERTP